MLPAIQKFTHRSGVLNALLERGEPPEETLQKFVEPFTQLALGALDIVGERGLTAGPIQIEKRDLGIQKSLVHHRTILSEQRDETVAMVQLSYSETNPMDRGLNLSAKLQFSADERRLEFNVTTWTRTPSDLQVFGAGLTGSEWLRLEGLAARVFEGRKI